MTSQSLYQISENLFSILSFIDDAETPEEKSALMEGLEIAREELDEKALNYTKFIQSEEQSIKTIDEEIKRLQALKKSKQNKIQILKERLSTALITFIPSGKLDLGIFKLSFRKSETVVINDPEDLPEVWLNKKVTYTPNKKEIKDALKAGESVPGCSIQVKQNLQIK